MDDIRSGKIKAALFLFFIVVLFVGGYIGAIMLTKDDSKSFKNEGVAKEDRNKVDDIRIDKNKDYIYFANEVIKNEDRDIIYQDVVFNFDSNDAKTIAAFLNSEREKNEAVYKTISDAALTLEEKENILFKDSDVYCATYNKYTRYFYKNYASIVSDTIEYQSTTGSKDIKVSAYVFDINNGNLLSKKNLMDIYDINLDKIKEKVKEKLEKEQTFIEGEPQIDIESTLRSLDNEGEYALYINKNGYLIISYFRKGMQDLKLDVIILN